MAFLRGWIYCLLWYSSIVAGYVGLFCPLFPILLLSNKLYRYLTDVIFTFWQSYPTALLEFLCKCDVQTFGDPIISGETSLIILNHRTRTDWNFLWPAVYHCTQGAGAYKYATKFILKDIIRHIPGAGWVMQLACFVYIKRSWIYDRKKIENLVNYFTDLKYKCSIVLFPEGTDFTPSTVAVSNRYADEHNLERYHFVLHPRTTGFAYLCRRLLNKQALDSIYDVTLVYPDSTPQTERVLLTEGFPREVKMHFTRYSSSVVPRSEAELGEFLKRKWFEKERTLREYHATGQFLHGQVLRRAGRFHIYFSLFFWSLLPYVVAYAFYRWQFFRLVVANHSVLLLVVNFVSDGFQDLEIFLYNFRKRWFKLSV